MSLVITYCCDRFVTIAAERDQVTLERSLHRVPGVPVVIATMGPSYGNWLTQWLSRYSVVQPGFSIDGIAHDFASAFFEHHDILMQARFASAGLRLPEALRAGTKEHALASAYVVVAGVDGDRAKAVATAYRQTDRRQQIDPAPYGRGLLHFVGKWDPNEPAIEFVKPATFDEPVAKRVLENVLFIRGERERLVRKTPAPLYDMVQISQRDLVEANVHSADASLNGIAATGAIRALTRHINELRDASFKEGVGD